MASKISLTPIFMVAFIGALGYSIVLPFLVVVVTQMGGNALVYGIVGATYSSFQLVGAPILGRWSDRFGRRRVLLISQLGTLVSWLVFLGALYLPMVSLGELDAIGGRIILSLPLLVLFLARALDGLTGGNVSVANAYLADVTSEVERDKMFGKMAVATNLGFIIGPILSGVLGATSIGASLPVLAAIAISAVAAVVISLRLPESNPCAISELPDSRSVRKVFGQEQRDCFEIASAEDVGFQKVLKRPGISFLLSLYFLIFLCFNIFYVAFPIHATGKLGWSTRELGLFFSFLGLTTVLVQGPLLSRVSGKIAEVKLVVVGALLLAASFYCLTSEKNSVLYVGASLFSLGNGLQWPSFLSVLSKTAGSKFQGVVQGFGGSVGSFASIVGLVLGGLAYASIGSSVFLASAGLMIAVAAISTRLNRAHAAN